MSPHAQQFPFLQRPNTAGIPDLAPLLPVTLTGSSSVSVLGLLDTGASVSVIPYDIGLRLGFDWAAQTIRLPLSGSVAGVEARAVLVQGTVVGFPPVLLAFAWANSDDVPVLLGQTNFFMEFDACFLRSRALFEIKPKP